MIPKVIEQLSLPPAELEETLQSGGSRVENEVRWAASYLKSAELLSKEDGIWLLTEKGQVAEKTIDQTRSIRTKMHIATNKAKRAKKKESLEKEEVEEELSIDGRLHENLMQLSPGGFERFCQLLLRKSGFEEVHVTGKSGDGGIDGYGTMRFSPFMSFHMIFQCKRFKGSVGPDVVRQLRGSLDGRTDKGLIVTTGRFTS